jgi:hypothetical protein
MTRTRGVAALLVVALAATILMTHLRTGASGPVDVEADLRTFAEAVSTGSEVLDRYGGQVSAELRECILTWSTVTRNDCASTGNLISKTFSADLSEIEVSGGTGTILMMSAITLEHSPHSILLRPLRALPLDALPSATAELRHDLGDTFFSYGTFCRTPPSGERNQRLFWVDSPGGEEGRLLQEAVERMIETCPVKGDLRFELTIRPAD